MSDISNSLVFINEEFSMFGWVLLVTFAAAIIGLLVMLFSEKSPSFLMMLILTIISLVSLIAVVVMGFVFQGQANDKNTIVVQTWLAEEHSIELNDAQVYSLLSEEGFEDFVTSDPQGDTRISGTFKNGGYEYFLVWKDEKLSLQKLDF